MGITAILSWSCMAISFRGHAAPCFPARSNTVKRGAILAYRASAVANLARETVLVDPFGNHKVWPRGGRCVVRWRRG